MLVIAANQTLLRYGINLEKAGPNDGSVSNQLSVNPDAGSEDSGMEGSATDREESENTQGSKQRSGDEDVSVRSVRETGEGGDASSNSQPSSVDDAALAMMESAAKKKDDEIKKLKRELKKKPKEVIKEVEKVIEVEKDPDFKLKTPKAIERLEKKLQEKLDGK